MARESASEMQLRDVKSLLAKKYVRKIKMAVSFEPNAQRSNFVDRMIDEVVRSTPSNAPMRSMT